MPRHRSLLDETLHFVAHMCFCTVFGWHYFQRLSARTQMLEIVRCHRGHENHGQKVEIQFCVCIYIAKLANVSIVCSFILWYFKFMIVFKMNAYVFVSIPSTIRTTIVSTNPLLLATSSSAFFHVDIFIPSKFNESWHSWNVFNVDHESCFQTSNAADHHNRSKLTTIFVLNVIQNISCFLVAFISGERNMTVTSSIVESYQQIVKHQ